MLAVLTTGKKDATPTTQAARPHDLQRRKDMKTISGHDALQNRTSPRMFFPERISS
mgnify:FL=1